MNDRSRWSWIRCIVKSILLWVQVIGWLREGKGLRAYALTLPLLGFECTWYEIKSRDMNEKGKEFIFYNKPYMPSAGLHGPLHMVCALSPVPAPTLALDLHAHTQLYCLLLLGQRGGGVHVLKCILLIPFE